MKRTNLDKIKDFFKETKAEMKRVNWLTKDQTIKYTLIVIVLSVALAAYLWALDRIFISVLMGLWQ